MRFVPDVKAPPPRGLLYTVNRNNIIRSPKGQRTYVYIVYSHTLVYHHAYPNWLLARDLSLLLFIFFPTLFSENRQSSRRAQVYNTTIRTPVKSLPERILCAYIYIYIIIYTRARAHHKPYKPYPRRVVARHQLVDGDITRETYSDGKTIYVICRTYILFIHSVYAQYWAQNSFFLFYIIL